MERLTVDDVLLQTLVTLINLGARKAGLATPPGEEAPNRDLEQTRAGDRRRPRAAAAARGAPRRRSSRQIKDALSRLQMAYVQLSGGERRRARRAAPSRASPSEAGSGAAVRAPLGPGAVDPRV